MKYFSLQAIFGNITSDNPIITGDNSKDALIRFFKERKIKVRIDKDKNNLNYSVVECDEVGRLHYDRRKWNYYSVIKI